ncbi:MAG TPA: hypothetical protein VII63_03760 [Caulobacteraceae bacterium]
MAFSPAWRMFRRMQDSTFAAAVLLYAIAALNAWRVLPGARHLKVQRILVLPGLFLIAAATGILVIPMLRSALSRHLWISFRTGFGQSVISVLAGVGVLAAAATFVFWQTWAAAHGGRYPAGAFSGYAAGVGLLLAQTILARRLERDPTLRSQIEEP